MFDVSYTWPLMIGVFVVLVTTYLLYIKWIRSHYPPGPWPLPIIGNLHLLSSSPHINLSALAEKYGPVFTIWMGTMPVVIGSKLEHFTEAMVQKGTDFDGRAFRGKFLDSMMHQNEDLITREYDEKVVLMRKMVMKCLKPGVLTNESIQSIVTGQIKELFQRLSSTQGRPLDARSTFIDFVVRVIGRVSMSLDHEDCRKCIIINSIAQNGIQKSALASFCPIFWFLQPEITRLLNDLNTSFNALMGKCLREHEKTYCEGEIRDLMDLMIKAKRDLDKADEKTCSLSNINIGLLSFEVFGGGYFTVLDTIIWSLLLLLKRPDILTKIQIELDKLALKKKRKEEGVMTENGKPFIEMSDKEELPYLQSFIYECMRSYPSVILSIPHRATRDTSLGSYYISENTAIMFNYYAINRDNEFWKKASEVLPERFIAEDGKLDLAKIKNVVTFGQGKRVCVGKLLAKTELILFMSNFLLNFELNCPSVSSLPKYDEGIYGSTFVPKDFDIIVNKRN